SAARTLDRPQELATAYVNLADHLHLAGRSRAALGVAADGLAAAGGDRRDAARRAGRSREALGVAEEGLGAADGDATYPSEWLALQAAEIDFDLGDWSAAAARVPAHAERRYTGAMLLHLLLGRAELALGRGEHDRAADLLRRASAGAEGSREPPGHGPLGALLAAPRRREGDLDAARAAVDDALDRIEFCTEDVARIARVSAAGVTGGAAPAQRAPDFG